MAYTQAQLDALDAAIAQGALSVQYGDKRVQYRDLNEMQRIRTAMRKELGLITSGGGRRFAEFSKGLK